MQIIKNPPESAWPELMRRPTEENALLFEQVAGILAEIKQKGDTAVKEFSLKFDGYAADSLEINAEEISSGCREVDPKLKEAIQQAKRNIEAFHKAQIQTMPGLEVQPGVSCWQRSVPIEKVGLYVPGGTAPLFSTVLMLAVPAQLAGCREIVLCSPPDKTGNIHPAILYTAHLCGIKRIFKIGGVQAIGAMAYGTETVPKVYKIFGPGNRYVTAAKQLVSLEDAAIDMPAGPSEVLVMADETAIPAFVAADLLSQAEHGSDSQVILLTASAALAEAVLKECQIQCTALPRADIAIKALENSRIILLKDREEILRFSNAYAPEHLIISMKDYRDLAGRVTNAGSVFLGNYSPESAGDYASGTNHTLPTKAYARAYSGLNLDSFMKKITFQEISREGLQALGPIIEIMAENEELMAHKQAVSIRLKQD
ncbi:MAG: histidinol dehydrogenase [Bacteroidales bacterium]|nr:histidinol dehydrogenase [Bacteroidales bacterium]MDD3430801.1 histidinol dehydrogenase [Bacteroidales bacterium]MDD4361389.1 histidinol dehydrogenase [Bacteroidales bacterium]MDD4430709.1 histidinol dehydrogenase [Bacteroidales bacterium]